MRSPRWRKVLRDLWSNKTRTLLVVLSIAVGVFAIGMVGGSRVILIRDLTGTWMAVNPASATLSTEAFDDELVQVVRKMPGVSAAEARRTIAARVKVGPEEWKNMSLLAIPDFNDMRIYTVRPLSGAYGYITLDTVEWLGQARDFNQLNIVVAEQKLDTDHIKAIASQVQTKLEKSGRIVFGTEVLDPGKHPMDSFVTALIYLLGIIAFFAVLLSGFLVVNTIGALLTQQTRQIGVMKSIGARSRDIVGMYLVTVLAFGLLSLFVSVPLGVLGAWALSSFFAGAFNFDITTVSVPPMVLALQVAAGLLVPLLAALVPVLSRTRITVREAISGYGLGKGRFGKGR